LRVARIVLVGFMGAGKSTVGPLLAARLGFQFIDADQHLEREAGLTVAEIFESQGEAAFRRMEAETVRQLIRVSGLVLALGGGALEAESTRTALKDAPQTCVVFLDAPVDTLLSRCERPSAGGTLAVRPLLAALREDRRLLEQKLSSRLEHYRDAHFTIATADLSPSQVAEEIVARLPGSQPLVSGSGQRPAPSEDIW
jgi:shikimate kinase